MVNFKILPDMTSLHNNIAYAHEQHQGTTSLIVDISKEKNTKYGYQTEISGDSDRQFMIV